MMFDNVFSQLLLALYEVILSVPFGAFLIVIGAIIYAPTGHRLGRYFILVGLLIFTIQTSFPQTKIKIVQMSTWICTISERTTLLYP